MKDGAVIYQPMKVRSWGSSGRSSLWLGPDHILEVSSGFVSESYRRWYWREIQAVVARTTAKRLGWNIFWGVLAMLALAGTAGFSTLAFKGSDTTEQTIFWVFTAVTGFAALGCLAIMIFNSLLGPTCEVKVHTTDGSKRLAALTRMHAFHGVAQTLRPLIEAAQQPAGSFLK